MAGKEYKETNLEYVVCFEPEVNGFTVRATTDSRYPRFIKVASFSTFEEAHWFIDFIKDCGGYDEYMNEVRTYNRKGEKVE